MRGYTTLTIAGLKSFVRDRAGLFWSLFFPLFLVVIFGAIFGKAGEEGSVKVPIGVVAPANLPPDVAWVPEILRTKVSALEASSGTVEHELAKLRAGKRRAVVVFPADFADTIHAGRQADIRIYADQSQPQMAGVAVSIIRNVLAAADKGLSASPTLLNPIEEKVEQPGEPRRKQRGIDFILPGILAMTIMQLGLFTAIPLVTMRERGILKRLRATPLTRPAFVGSQVTQRLLIALVQTTLLVGLASMLYGFRVAGSWFSVFGIVAIGTLMFIALGAILSGIAKTQESCVALVQVVNMPMMFLSGIFFPLELIPNYLRPVTAAIPTTYLCDALRQVTLAAPAAHPIALDVAIVAVWLVGGLIVAARFFRWD